MTTFKMQNRASGCAIDVWMQRNSGGASSHGSTAPSLIYIPLVPGGEGRTRRAWSGGSPRMQVSVQGDACSTASRPKRATHA